MTNEQRMLADTVAKIFAGYGDDGATVARDWSEIAASGLPTLLVPEASGGFGGSWNEAAIVFRLAGAHAVALPIVEATIAGFYVGGGELPGFGTVAARTQGSIDGGRFTGVLHGVPWGREAGHVVAELAGNTPFVLPCQAAMCDRSTNAAGEPRDTLYFDGCELHSLPQQAATVHDVGTLARTIQMAGALDAALALSIHYANERVQFGKPLARLQAIQQALARFASEVAAVDCAATGAVRAAGDVGTSSTPITFEIAAAKLRANIATGIGTAIAHQVHGGIGFTQEYPLQRLTRLLWAWRSEFGGDQYWASRLGERVASRGAAAFWSDMVARTDPLPAPRAKAGLC